jgi:hypothetical protein
MGLRSSVGILLLMLGCIAGILLGMLLVVRWQLAIPAKVLEDKGVTDAMFRSSQLNSGNRGRIFLILLLFGVLGQALEKLLQWPLELAPGVRHVFLSPRVASGWQVASLGALFIPQCLVGPLAAIAFTLLYTTTKGRKNRAKGLPPSRPLATPISE